MQYFKAKKYKIKSQGRYFQPIRVLQVDIGHPLPDIPAFDMESNQDHQRAISLVRLHTQPLGMVGISWGKKGLTAAEYAAKIWQTLAAEINKHLQEDGLPSITSLPVTGLRSIGTARCLHEREKLLANPPFVSIVIATRNRRANLAKCLSSLLCLDYPKYEIIVVDSAPSSNQRAAFISRRYGHLKQVRYVRENRRGLAKAYNRGFEEVKTPIVAFTDDDVIVDKHWLTELVKGFGLTNAGLTNGERVGCVTGMLMPTELETPPELWIEQHDGFSKGFGGGANMAFNSSVLRDLGGFDRVLEADSTTLGRDNLAAFFKIMTQDYKLLYEPAAIVHYAHQRDYTELRKPVYGYDVELSTDVIKNQLDLSRLFALFGAHRKHLLFNYHP